MTTLYETDMCIHCGNGSVASKCSRDVEEIMKEFIDLTMPAGSDVCVATHRISMMQSTASNTRIYFNVTDYILVVETIQQIKKKIYPSQPNFGPG